MPYTPAPKKKAVKPVVEPLQVAYVTKAGKPDNTEDITYHRVEPFQKLTTKYHGYKVDESVDLNEFMFSDWLKHLFLSIKEPANYDTITTVAAGSNKHFRFKDLSEYTPETKVDKLQIRLAEEIRDTIRRNKLIFFGTDYGMIEERVMALTLPDDAGNLSKDHIDALRYTMAENFRIPHHQLFGHKVQIEGDFFDSGLERHTARWAGKDTQLQSFPRNEGYAVPEEERPTRNYGETLEDFCKRKGDLYLKNKFLGIPTTALSPDDMLALRELDRRYKESRGEPLTASELARYGLKEGSPVVPYTREEHEKAHADAIARERKLLDSVRTPKRITEQTMAAAIETAERNMAMVDDFNPRVRKAKKDILKTEEGIALEQFQKTDIDNAFRKMMERG